jgi:hypothetical protein
VKKLSARTRLDRFLLLGIYTELNTSSRDKLLNEVEAEAFELGMLRAARLFHPTMWPKMGSAEIRQTILSKVRAGRAKRKGKG